MSKKWLNFFRKDQSKKAECPLANEEFAIWTSHNLNTPLIPPNERRWDEAGPSTSRSPDILPKTAKDTAKAQSNDSDESHPLSLTQRCSFIKSYMTKRRDTDANKTTFKKLCRKYKDKMFNSSQTAENDESEALSLLLALESAINDEDENEHEVEDFAPKWVGIDLSDLDIYKKTENEAAGGSNRDNNVPIKSESTAVNPSKVTNPINPVLSTTTKSYNSDEEIETETMERRKSKSESTAVNPRKVKNPINPVLSTTTKSYNPDEEIETETMERRKIKSESTAVNPRKVTNPINPVLSTTTKSYNPDEEIGMETMERRKTEILNYYKNGSEPSCDMHAYNVRRRRMTYTIYNKNSSAERVSTNKQQHCNSNSDVGIETSKEPEQSCSYTSRKKSTTSNTNACSKVADNSTSKVEILSYMRKPKCYPTYTKKTVRDKDDHHKATDIEENKTFVRKPKVSKQKEQSNMDLDKQKRTPSDRKTHVTSYYDSRSVLLDVCEALKEYVRNEPSASRQLRSKQKFFQNELWEIISHETDSLRERDSDYEEEVDKYLRHKYKLGEHGEDDSIGDNFGEMVSKEDKCFKDQKENIPGPSQVNSDKSVIKEDYKDVEDHFIEDGFNELVKQRCGYFKDKKRDISTQNNPDEFVMKENKGRKHQEDNVNKFVIKKDEDHKDQEKHNTDELVMKERRNKDRKYREDNVHKFVIKKDEDHKDQEKHNTGELVMKEDKDYEDKKELKFVAEHFEELGARGNEHCKDQKEDISTKNNVKKLVMKYDKNCNNQEEEEDIFTQDNIGKLDKDKDKEHNSNTYVSFERYQLCWL